MPTMMRLARAGGFSTSLVVGKDKLKILAIPGSTAFYMAGSTEGWPRRPWRRSRRCRRSGRALPGGGPDRAFQGVDVPAYLEAVGETDQALGRIVDALGEQTTIIVTADHGGVGQRPQRGRTQDMLIPWVMVGPGVPRGRVLTRTVKTVDTAATAVRFLGLSLAPDAEGRAVAEVFSCRGRAVPGRPRAGSWRPGDAARPSASPP